MKNLRLIALTLAIVLTVTMLSCGSEKDGNAAETTAPETRDVEQTTATPDDTEVTDDLPNEDFEGYNFRILSSIRGSATLNAFPAAESGDTINDAYYRRNDAVSERFKVSFTESTDGNGHSLFAANTLSRAGVLREYELDFGIIPIPTADEKKPGEAYSGRTDSLVPYVVPVTNSDLHRTAVILEALACEGHRTVVPTYYDVVLGQKETRDNDSVEMLEMMFANRCIELETIMLASRFIEKNLGAGEENFVSMFKSKLPELNGKLNDLIRANE